MHKSTVKLIYDTVNKIFFSILNKNVFLPELF